MSNKPALIITGVVALLAVVAVIFTIIIVSESGSNDKTQEFSDNIGVSGINDEVEDFVPDEVLEQEMRQAAAKLVQDNFEVFRLFYLVSYNKNTHFKPEPFGNPSEDGYRNLKDGIIEYNTVTEIFEFVDATFVSDAAGVIKHFSPQTSDGSPVYKNRNGGIGVNETYSPKTYDLIWGNVEIALIFISENESIISVTLDNDTSGRNNDNEFNETESESEKQMRMLKEEDGVWRLENIFF